MASLSKWKRAMNEIVRSLYPFLLVFVVVALYWGAWIQRKD